MAVRPPIRLPKHWPRHVRSGVLHAISLASIVLAFARGHGAGRSRLRSQLEQATSEIALLREELLIKGGRWERSRSKRRPHYSAVQRMRILQLRAARGWTLEKTARIFLIDLQTLLHWMRRVDEPGERSLIQTAEPVIRYPDFVRNLVRQLKCLLPAMGYERMAQVLARVGLALGAVVPVLASTAMALLLVGRGGGRSVFPSGRRVRRLCSAADVRTDSDIPRPCHPKE